ncbi:MAG: peptide-methionine (S)-S-oxide reductase [Ignavibacteria bacterium CG_4_8_14_3_um_filter_37_9]|nr:peptide-methionine (S)-S-oxide reductase MsrA [Ignavibacteria bacterium]OIO13658.1 MAG: peptide-methionine (S)-S-oxide reductase [Ignavibacteria bacterium CG1_02_37_35]PIP78590.1 MAG: peptide-methionine (S)-S-oxide reductase [Ignavibacteria bacterium CG22_combo_CG10-13_8_21_14_all_37_15]PIS45433.1 MAG: peptide-methionine (S)-S-oxide reductase [Ignavibacteria bacterium CG08_land_8_20_14_0_20_37_9]PIX00246.1 MAG: peptide-methionine (S)-S-oxide reductase [Ignavibacteria bacterium CG_4_8_14_3_um
MTKYIFLLLLISLTACNKSKDNNNFKDQEIMETTTKLDTATFGSGCFWCSEAIFERVKGVHEVISGYAGGTTENPSYEQVCTGKTGHAEVCQIMFDPSAVSFADLLKIFWKTHDPTTLNRQGADSGTQYRSVIFYHSEEQKKIAQHYKVELDNSGAWADPIVTEISPFTKFFPAEAYHQNYFANNPTQGYCSFIIAPKVEKFEKVFKEKLK